MWDLGVKVGGVGCLAWEGGVDGKLCVGSGLPSRLKQAFRARKKVFFFLFA